MTRMLAAIMEPEAAKPAFDALGDCDIVVEAGLTAIVWRDGASLAAKIGRAFAGKALVRFQQILETLQTLGPILPAAPGVTFEDMQAARRFLAANAQSLRAGLDQYGPMRQLQITIAWNPELALKRHLHEPELAEARQIIAVEGLRRAGKAIQSGMEAVRARLAAEFESRLAAVSVERIQLPGDANTVLNLVVAAPGEKLGEVEMAVEAIDATWPDGLKIKIIGPLPTVSFASVAADKADESAVSRARQRLGLEPEDGAEAIREAFRKIVRQTHPDLGGDAGQQREIVDARALLARVEAAAAALQAAGHDPSEAPVPIARLRREGDKEMAA